MSGAHAEEVVKSAIPIPDLGLIDAALRGDEAALKAAVQKHRPADLGRDFSRRSVAECRRLIEVADDRHAAAMLRSAHPAVAANVIGSCSPAHASRLLAFMPTDHRVAILGAVDAGNRSAIEAALPPEQKDDAARILAYRESAVARLMTPKIWRVDRARTAGEAMAVLREHGDQIEVAQSCYVVDGDKLVGVAALREVSIAAPEARLEDLMARDPIAVSEETERGDAAEIIQTHDFLSLPVITRGGKVVALSFFIPLLIGTGGNAGSQTVSTVIRALALGEVRMKDVLRVLVKEVTTGIVLGVFLGAIAFGRARLRGVGNDLAGCVGITVLVVCTWASTVGAVIPIAAQRAGVDPTVISGPLITTLVDASGLFLYLTIAKFMIASLHGG